MKSHAQTLLNQMGITTWQATMDFPGAKTVVHYKVFQLTGQNRALIIENGASLTDDESLLLNNMLNSVDLAIQSESLESDISKTANCIVMALNDDLLTKISRPTENIIQVSHPKSILSGASKKNAWHQLLNFVD